MHARKLYRSRTDHLIAGVAGGLAEYFQIDPTVVRLVCLLVILAWGTGIFLYIIGWLLIPAAPGPASPRFDRLEALRGRLLAAAKAAEEWLKRRLHGHGSAPGETAGAPSPASQAPVGGGLTAPPAEGMPAGSAGGEGAASQPGDPGASGGEAGGAGAAMREAGPPAAGVASDAAALKAIQQRRGGLILVAVGALFLLRAYFPWFDFDALWPLLLIGAGVILIVQGARERKGP